MFTGIVQSRGWVRGVQPNAFGSRLVVDCSKWELQHFEPTHGDSICVSGVCLTVVEVTNQQWLSFDVITETLSKTTLGEMEIGNEVNLELPISMSQPLGGHFVQGHVDGVGRVTHVCRGDNEWRVTVEPPSELADCIVPKGSIAIDGVSLTIAAINKSVSNKVPTFEIALIPTTLQLTSLGQIAVGQRVNLEADIISKTVIHYLQGFCRHKTFGMTREDLQKAGFVG